MGRKILAVLAGGVLGGIVVFLVEMLGHAVYPPPSGFDPRNPEAVKTLMADLPAGALGFILLAYALGCLAGGWMAARISRGSEIAVASIVGLLFVLGSLYNLMTIPHPAWFGAASLAIPLPAAWLGGRLAKPTAAGTFSAGS